MDNTNRNHLNTARSHLHEALMYLLLSEKTRGATAASISITNAQDALLGALGTLEDAAFDYQPTDQFDSTGRILFRQEVVDDKARELYLELQAIIKPVVDVEKPDPEAIDQTIQKIEQYILNRLVG